MKKIVLALTLGVLVAGSSIAQTTTPHQDTKARSEHRHHRQHERKSPEERAQQRTERLSKQLGLNKSQTRRLQALNLKQAQEMQALHANRQRGEKPSPQLREQMKARHAAYQAELKDILTKKQYAQYQEKRDEMRAQRRERGHHRNPEQGRKYNGR